MHFTKFMFSMFVCIVFVTIIQAAPPIKIANIETYNLASSDSSSKLPTSNSNFNLLAGQHYSNLQQQLQSSELKGWLETHYLKISNANDENLQYAFTKFLEYWLSHSNNIEKNVLQDKLEYNIGKKVQFYNILDEDAASAS